MTPFNPKKVKKSWGYERWLANNEEEDYCGKILHIKEGKSTSLHYHIEKHETFYVLKGTLMVEMWKYGAPEELRKIGVEGGEHGFSVICEEGKSMEMDRGRMHKLIAHEGDVSLIEISTFHKDKDSHRME